VYSTEQTYKQTSIAVNIQGAVHIIGEYNTFPVQFIQGELMFSVTIEQIRRVSVKLSAMLYQQAVK